MEDLQEKMPKYYTQVTPMTDLTLILAQMLDPFWWLRSFSTWNKVMDIHSVDKTSYTNKYLKAFCKYVENQNCVKY
jgi:hypothetical protein